jgi:hypothetical protein
VKSIYDKGLENLIIKKNKTKQIREDMEGRIKKRNESVLKCEAY